jgi:hypothetical protein
MPEQAANITIFPIANRVHKNDSLNSIFPYLWPLRKNFYFRGTFIIINKFFLI